VPDRSPGNLPRQLTSFIGGIAGRLCLSVRTVDTHVDHILTKLGFTNRAQPVAWAYESGLTPGAGHRRRGVRTWEGER
jgi:hypothetical protein